MYHRAVKWLNYHHLLYFWTVAKEGTITAACKKLRLAQPTVSKQLGTLEETLGHKLFRRVGRNLVLTETGRVAYRYANEIFSLGRELVDTLEGHPTGKRTRLRIGVADVLPKVIVQRLLRPALKTPDSTHVVCYEGKPKALLAQLSVHELDLVLSDSPMGPEVKVRAFNHLLGECGVSVFGIPRLSSKYRHGFPQSLDRAPFYLPTDNTSVRRQLDFWFISKGFRPFVVAEFEDSALLSVFGGTGDALFPGPQVVEEEIEEFYGVTLVGRLESVRETFYAISPEQQLKHPAVVQIVESAHDELFA